MYLQLEHSPHASGGTIECTASVSNLGTYSSANFSITNNLGGYGNGGTALDGIASSVNTTIVCALDPGEGIDGYWAQGGV